MHHRKAGQEALRLDEGERSATGPARRGITQLDPPVPLAAVLQRGRFAERKVAARVERLELPEHAVVGLDGAVRDAEPVELFDAARQPDRGVVPDTGDVDPVVEQQVRRLDHGVVTQHAQIDGVGQRIQSEIAARVAQPSLGVGEVEADRHAEGDVLDIGATQRPVGGALVQQQAGRAGDLVEDGGGPATRPVGRLHAVADRAVVVEPMDVHLAVRFLQQEQTGRAVDDIRFDGGPAGRPVAGLHPRADRPVRFHAVDVDDPGRCLQQEQERARADGVEADAGPAGRPVGGVGAGADGAVVLEPLDVHFAVRLLEEEQEVRGADPERLRRRPAARPVGRVDAGADAAVVVHPLDVHGAAVALQEEQERRAADLVERGRRPAARPVVGLDFLAHHPAGLETVNRNVAGAGVEEEQERSAVGPEGLHDRPRSPGERVGRAGADRPVGIHRVAVQLAAIGQLEGDVDSRHGALPAGERARGTLQWVGAERALLDERRRVRSLLRAAEGDGSASGAGEPCQPDQLPSAGTPAEVRDRRRRPRRVLGMTGGDGRFHEVAVAGGRQQR